MPTVPTDNKDLPSLPPNHSYASKEISLVEGHEILNSYCRTCLESQTCRMVETLGHMMANNIPYWSDKFKFVKAVLEEKLGSNVPSFDVRLTKPVCLAYRSKQRPLPGMPTQHTDAVYRVMELLAPELARRRAFVEQQNALWAEMALNHTHYGNKHTRENACHLQG